MKRGMFALGLVVLWVLGSASYGQGQPGFMGVHLDSARLPDLLTKHLGLDAGQGVRIMNITVGSPADRAGLERDDIIVAFQDKKVTSAGQIVEAVHSKGAGDEVSLDVIHLGQRKTLQLELEKARENAELKYPPEPEAMTTWRPGKFFRIGPNGQEWLEVPFDKLPEFDMDVDKFFKELHTYHHRTDGEDFTITIEGDPRDEGSEVIVQVGGKEYRATVGNLDAVPEKYRGPAHDAIENARKNVQKEIVIEKKFRLPQPPRPETYQRFFRSIPRPDLERFSEQSEQALEKVQEQLERLQQRMQDLEQRNREMWERFLEKRDAKGPNAPVPEKSAPAEPGKDGAI